jgi:hypothetical protein
LFDSPAQIPSLLVPIIHGDATVVYGTRTFGSHNAYSYLYVLGNKAVTTFANMLFNCYISDLETCFKLIPTDLYRSLEWRNAFIRKGASGGKATLYDLNELGYSPGFTSVALVVPPPRPAHPS